MEEPAVGTGTVDEGLLTGESWGEIESSEVTSFGWKEYTVSERECCRPLRVEVRFAMLMQLRQAGYAFTPIEELVRGQK